MDVDALALELLREALTWPGQRDFPYSCLSGLLERRGVAREEAVASIDRLLASGRVEHVGGTRLRPTEER